MTQTNSKVPRAFVSYAWEDDEHKDWVRRLAARLRCDGVDVLLDRWEAVPGDQLPQFMERAVRDADYVLIVCTPRYKQKSDGRVGGVGYEGDIMTGEALVNRDPRKFIPILRKGSWKEAAPSWLVGKYYVDLRGDPYSVEHYQDLLTTFHGQRAQAPPLGPAPQWSIAGGQPATPPAPAPSSPVRTTGVLVDEVTAPRKDGTRGSALYSIPFQLSRRPAPEWSKLFVEIWRRPPSCTTMHRPSIAKVVGDRIILDGTTIEEVEEYHRDTLKLVVDRVNEVMAERESAKRRQLDEASRQRQLRDAQLREVASRLTFDTDEAGE
jgi:hypothetical protein